MRHLEITDIFHNHSKSLENSFCSLANWSLQNFAQNTTMVLSWYVREFTAIKQLVMELQLDFRHIWRTNWKFFSELGFQYYSWSWMLARKLITWSRMPNCDMLVASIINLVVVTSHNLLASDKKLTWGNHHEQVIVKLIFITPNLKSWHFADDILNFIKFNEHFYIFIRI